MGATGTDVLGEVGPGADAPVAIVVDQPFNRIGRAMPGEANYGNIVISLRAHDVVVLGNGLGVDGYDQQ